MICLHMHPAQLLPPAVRGAVVWQEGMESKRCFKCGEVKPLDEFYRHKQMADGHLNKCKECTKSDVKKHRDAHPESDLKTRLKACEKNPTKKNANMAVDAAIRSGVLEKPGRCQGCGRSGKDTRLGSHHYDYTKPLDVVWVCAACHKPMDRIRAFVESGESWSEYGKKRMRAYNAAKRALDYYSINVSSIDTNSVLNTLGWR